MRTSLTDIARIESYLQGKLGIAATLLFEARMILDPSLSASVKCQQTAEAIVLLHGRNELRKQIRAKEQQLFNPREPSKFRKEIDQIFKN
jgi:hypothetical protein